MAHIISIPLTPEQFSKAQIALDGAEGVTHTGDDKSGTVHSKQVDFNYTYDGVNFSMDITGRHGMEAKLASDEQIKEHIQGMLSA